MAAAAAGSKGAAASRAAAANTQAAEDSLEGAASRGVVASRKREPERALQVMERGSKVRGRARLQGGRAGGVRGAAEQEAPGRRRCMRAVQRATGCRVAAQR